jgi:hypothetical protein
VCGGTAGAAGAAGGGVSGVTAGGEACAAGTCAAGVCARATCMNDTAMKSAPSAANVFWRFRKFTPIVLDVRVFRSVCIVYFPALRFVVGALKVMPRLEGIRTMDTFNFRILSG